MNIFRLNWRMETLFQLFNAIGEFASMLVFTPDTGNPYRGCYHQLGNSLKTVPFVLGPKTVPFLTIFQCARFPPLSLIFSMHSVRIM